MSSSITDYLNLRLPTYIKMLQSMVEINSFTSNRTGVNQLAKLTAEYFSKIGFVPEFVPSVNRDFGNHLFLKYPINTEPGKGEHPKPSIILISHLDTVFSADEEIINDFHFQISGDRIYGPGTVDIKGGTVMIYILMDIINQFNPELFNQVEWMIALDASEETLSNDFGSLCKERMHEKAHACLIFEGGTPNHSKYSIVTCRKGRAEFRVSAQGRGAHAGNYHKQGANAIVQLSHAIQQIAGFTEYKDQITFNVGVITGGSVVNRVPHFAEAAVEMRAFAPDIFKAGIEKIMALDGSSSISSHDGYPCRISVQMISSTDPWSRNPDTDWLYGIWKQAGADFEMEIVPEERGGLSDGNLLWPYAPTIDGLGPSGNNAHCSEKSPDNSKEQEYVLLPSFIPKANLNYHALLKLIELANLSENSSS